MAPAIAPQPPNNTYIRTPFVEIGYAFNFLNAPLELTSAYDNGQLIVSSQFLCLPILILVVGLVVYFIMALVYACQWICCCECKQKVIPTSHVEIIKDVIHNYQNCCTATFYTLCIYMILIVQLIAYRRTDLLNGIQSSSDFAAFMNAQSSALVKSSTSVTAAVAVMVADIKAAPTSCIGKNLTSSVMKLNSEASKFSTAIQPLTYISNELKTTLDAAFGDAYLVEFVIWVLYSVPVLAGLFLAYNHWHRNKIGVNFFLISGGITYIVSVVASFLLLSSTMILANICMSPLSGFVKIAPEPLRPTMTYYSSCFDVNPIFNHTSYALKQLDRINSIYNTSCRSSTQKSAAFVSHNAASRLAILNAESSLSCPIVRKRIVSFVQDTICGAVYTFSYSVWFALAASSLFMFLLFIIGIAAYRYESEDHIDHFVETTYNPDYAHSFDKFKSTGMIGGEVTLRRSAKVSDFGDDSSPDRVRTASFSKDDL